MAQHLFRNSDPKPRYDLEMATFHIPETELAGNLEVLMARVRAGGEVVIESSEGPIAVLTPPPAPQRTLAERIALLPEDSAAVMDEDFARDVAEAIEAHREPLSAPAWD
jgi:antitoxin (DNA-binding transcriptional repressor) of toxin-antitoxin stability system